MADSVIIGRVAVRVVPDTKRFRRDTQRDLNRIEKALKLNVKVNVGIDKRQMQHVQDQLDDIDDNLKVDVGLDIQSGQLRRVQATLARLSRTRFVQLVPVVSKPAAAKAATVLAALSGGRAIAHIFEDISNVFKNLDKSLPLIGTMALAILNLGSVGITAASNLFALSSSLASIAGAALALPGILGALAIGTTITVIGFMDMKKVLPDVFEQFKQLRALISKDFWKGAKDGIRDLVKVSLPQLGTVAKEIGDFWGGLAKSLAKPFKAELPVMFKNLETSIIETTKHTDSFAGIITKLGKTGSEYLPRLAKFVGQIADGFDKWLNDTLGDGRLKAFIETGIQAMKDLGNVTKSLFGIFAGLGRAAKQAGGSTLAILADTLDRVNKVVNGPTFQAGMTKVFSAAHTAISALVNEAGPPLLDLFSSLAENLTVILPLAGQALGTLLGSIATALSNQAFMSGFTAFLAGLAAGLTALAPAAAPLGKALGALGGALGALAQTLGSSLGIAITALSQMLIDLLPAIRGIIPVLGAGLIALLQILAPVLVDVAKALAPVIVSLGPVFGDAITRLIPPLTIMATQLGTVLVDALRQIGPLLPQIVTAFVDFAIVVLPLVPAVLKLVAALLPFATQVLAYLVAGLPQVVEAFHGLVGALLPVVAAAVQLAQVLGPILVPVLKFLGSILIDTVVMAIKGVTNVIKGLTNFLAGTVQFWSDLLTGQWGKLWDDFLRILLGAWQLILGALQILLTVGIGKVVKLGFLGLKLIFKGGWDAIVAGAKLFMEMTRGNWLRFLGDLKAAPGGALNAIKGLFTRAWDNLLFSARYAWGQYVAIVKERIGGALAVVRGLPGQIKSALGNLGGTLVAAGKALIQGFIDGITRMIGSVKSTLQGLTSKLKDWKGPARTDAVLLQDAGQLVIEGFIKGLESKYDAVRKSLRGLSRDIAGTDMGTIDMQLSSSGKRVSAADFRPPTDGPGDGGSAGQEINFYGNVGWDPDEVAKQIATTQQDANTIAQLSTGVHF